MSIHSDVSQRFRNFDQKAEISPKRNDLFWKEFRIRGIFVYFLGLYGAIFSDSEHSPSGFGI